MIGTLASLMILFLSGANAADCSPPNGTTGAIHWWQCYAKDPVHYISVMFEDKTGRDIYPIKLNQPFVVHVKIDNTNGALDNLKADARLWQWTGSGQKCFWKEIPNFGALNNLIECGNQIDCPVKPGNQDLRIPVDLASVTHLANFKGDSQPYKVEYRLRDPMSKKTTCIALETMIQKN